MSFDDIIAKSREFARIRADFASSFQPVKVQVVSMETQIENSKKTNNAAISLGVDKEILADFLHQTLSVDSASDAKREACYGS